MPRTSFLGVVGLSGVIGAPNVVPKTLVVGCDARAPNALVATEPKADDPESGAVSLSADVKLLVPLPANALNAFPAPGVVPATLPNEAGLLAKALNPPLVAAATGDATGVVEPNALCPKAGC